VRLERASDALRPDREAAGAVAVRRVAVLGIASVVGVRLEGGPGTEEARVALREVVEGGVGAFAIGRGVGLERGGKVVCDREVGAGLGVEAIRLLADELAHLVIDGVALGL
jgi:hypothetical protein